MVGTASLVLAGCSSSAKPAATHHGATTTSTTTGAGSATSGPGPSSPSSGTTGSSSSSKSSTPSTTSASTHSNQSAGGPTPPAAGTYTYDQQGSVSALGQSQSFPPQGTDVIDAPSAQGSGSWAQVWHSYLNTSQPPNDSTFLITPSGIALTSEVIRMAENGQTITFTCTFSAPIEIIDWPVTVGHAFSGSGSCTSPNNSYGSFTVSVSGKVSGTQSTSIGGPSTTAYVISTDVSTTGSVDSTSTQTDWFDPGSRLDLYENSQEHGTYEGIGFSSQVTRTLVSRSPS